MTFPYQIALGAATGTSPTQVLTAFESWTLERNLDDGCSLSFSVPGNSLPAVLLEELETDLWLYRDGVLEQRFRVVEINREWDANGSGSLAVQAACYRRLLRARHVLTPLTYTGISQGQIIWNLIQHTQGQPGGNLGITLGTTGPAILRDRAYEIGTNILDAITDLGRMLNGPTWEIDELLQLNVSVASAYPSKPQPVQVGTNALTLRKPSGAASFANAVIVTGDTRLTSPVYLAVPTITTDPRGRWERYASYPQEGSNTALTEQANGLLEASESPLIIYDFTLEPDRYFTDSHYNIGDFITIVEPPIVVPSNANPTIAAYTVPGNRVAAQVLTERVVVSNSGQVDVSMTAILAYQRWDDIPYQLLWDDLSPALTWDSLADTYLTL